MLPGPTVLTAKRPDDWRDILAQAFVPLEAKPLEERFRGSVRAGTVADLQLSVVSGSGQVVQRTRRLVSQGATDLVKVGVQLRGHGRVEQSGRVAELDPGDIAVYDTSRPYDLVFGRSFEMLVLMVEHRRLSTRAPGLDDLTAVRIHGAAGSGALASALIRGLSSEADRPGAEAGYLSDAAIDLLGACLVGCARSEEAEPAAETVVLAARRYIDDRLWDPDLRPAEVAIAVHVSLRHLQKLFQRRGNTVAGLIRERRLERCWLDLGDPRLADRPVAAVAATWGLPDAAQFSRSFRARYGQTPRSRRSEAIAAGC